MEQAKNMENSAAPPPADTFFPGISRGGRDNTCLRVAAYIRVSSANPEQEDSYALQERYFTRLLAENPRWTSAGIYSDYAISGTDGKKRTGFTRLLRHAREGRIDRIISKSISRFARNTNDFLAAMRLFREQGVTIFFEKENLDTADCASTFIMTTLGAIAQEESHSISENVRWGFQKRFPNGEARNVDIYGYRYAVGEDAYQVTPSAYRFRRVEIVEEEAEIVRRIFREVAAGQSYISVARGLNRDGIPAPENGSRREADKIGWTGGRIRGMIAMERYAGDLLLQKQFTPDYLTHRPRANRGELPRYYVKNHHPAIISRELFRSAQGESGRRKAAAATGGYPFSGRLFCAHCGRVYHTYNRKHNPIWVCATVRQNNGKGLCHAERIYEAQILHMLRLAMAERYGKISGPLREDCTAEEILRCPESLLREESEDFVARMLSRLKAAHSLDTVERDRAFLKRQLFALEREVDRLKYQASGSERERKLTENAERISAHMEKMERMERYWAAMEADFPRREAALQWMSALPAGREGTVLFFRGLTAEYARAFVQAITVYAPTRYRVFWFDGASTEVSLDGGFSL